MASLGRLKNTSAIFQRLKPRFPEKWKGGRLEKIGNYFYNIYADYKIVAIETVQDMKKKPVKSSVYISLLTTFGVLMKTKPNQKDFREKLRENSNDLLLVGESIRNPNTDKHLACLLKLENENCLRFLNLGICTLVFKSDFSSDADIFVARCKLVRPHFTEFHKGILDIGIFNRWIYLDKSMVDYDVNTEEWLEDGSPKNKTILPPMI